MEGTLMKLIRFISTGVLVLFLGTIAPTCAQQEQGAKPEKQEQQTKPKKQQEAKPGKQEQQQAKGQQQQKQKQQQQQAKTANQNEQRQARGQQQQQQKQQQQQAKTANQNEQRQARGQQQQQQKRETVSGCHAAAGRTTHWSEWHRTPGNTAHSPPARTGSHTRCPSRQSSSGTPVASAPETLPSHWLPRAAARPLPASGAPHSPA